MAKKYYVAMAISVDSYEQSDYLYLISLDGGELIGYSAEFESCTRDIADACDAEKFRRAKWFGWNRSWLWRAASLDEIEALNLDKYLIGFKKDMKLDSQIESL